MSNTLLLAISVIIVLICAVSVYISLRKVSKNKEEAEKFIGNLADTITVSIANTIETSFPGEYNTFEEFETTLLSEIYESTFKLVHEEAEKAFANNIIIKAVLDKIDSQAVLKFIDSILESTGLKAAIENKYGVHAIENDNSVAEDEELSEKFSNQEEFVENSESIELEEAEPVVVSDDELASLNPQRDDEEDYNPEDESMEIIEEPTTRIETAQDKNGNTLYYEIDELGKKKRVSKEYAITKMI